MARVIISAGHSPSDKGAVVGDLVEYDLTQKIVDELEPLLAKYPKLELKRIPAGLSLPQKIQWINNSGYTAENNDVAVEIHINDADGTEDGVECWYSERGDNASKDMCTKIMDAVCLETGMRKRAVKSEYDHEFRRLGYVHNTVVIAGLFEIGFMDNEKDVKILTSEEGVKKVAKGLLKGILTYFGLKEGETNKNPITTPAYPIHTEPDQYSIPYGMNTGAGISPMGAGTMPMGMPSMPSMVDASNFAMPSAPISMDASPIASSMAPEEKKEMITKWYQKVLGRNPDASGLNYYANSNMSEEALIKLMVESQEHQNIVKAARDYVTMKEQFDRAQREISGLKTNLLDKEAEVKSMSEYLQSKSQQIAQLTEDMQKQTSGSDESVSEEPKQENGARRKKHGVFNMLKKLGE